MCTLGAARAQWQSALSRVPCLVRVMNLFLRVLHVFWGSDVEAVTAAAFNGSATARRCSKMLKEWSKDAHTVLEELPMDVVKERSRKM
mmetsp:Transcript_20287/g.43989  ORF Transcript_20287/g.43989 Transcript_20287/m.43989 type:complete len:88 (+) Transcript_20287:108-371(+)